MSVLMFLIYNFTLTLFLLGLAAAGVAIAVKGEGFTRAALAEELLAYFILCSITLSFFYNFIMHVFFGELAAGFIGWADSPFQAEVGYASLGYALIGLIAFKGGLCTRLAAIAGPAMFQWGAAAGHVHDMLAHANYAPGNAGVMLYSDMLLPLIGFALLWFKWTSAKAAIAPQR